MLPYSLPFFFKLTFTAHNAPRETFWLFSSQLTDETLSAIQRWQFLGETVNIRAKAEASSPPASRLHGLDSSAAAGQVCPENRRQAAFPPLGISTPAGASASCMSKDSAHPAHGLLCLPSIQRDNSQRLHRLRNSFCPDAARLLSTSSLSLTAHTAGLKGPECKIHIHIPSRM